ncbi:uncharacterized protein LY89DRAFT_780508 [Mollisia scopiformis]|uniref:Zn(2)-C6 fungal-type domain-containing protein n=1 Tax=Mollisia scopiformis TaxID=149040 RepID=A0A194XHA5_MOLSC|nr:uncharacterized protein LY89DRAFT_780508 [Mollisia scopiformis]KUJ19590.1 hypothetical protein LY89DRAFT_780508 [Mollisia scopiformis]
MVYTGPSRACARCRQMKKKCDQMRPQCTRCIEARIECYGYRDEFDILYRDERAKARARTIAPKMGEASSRAALPLIKREPAPTSVSSAVDLSLTSVKAQDMIPFFQQFSDPAKSCGWPGWLSKVPEQYAAAPENACFKPALLAASFAILAKKQDDVSYQNTARAFYVSALEAISQALNENRYDDSTMLAISLLDTFQFIMEESVGTHGQHIAGLKAVLALRQSGADDKEECAKVKAESDGKLGHSIFAFMPQIQTLLHEIRTHQTPSEGSVEWVTNLSQEFGGARSATALLQFGKISAQSHQLCKVVRRDLVEGRIDFEAHLDSTELMSLVQISELVDQTNQNWSENGNSKWEITRRPNGFGLNAGGFPLIFLDSYHDLWTACVWNVNRAARIVLMDTIIESAELLAAFNTDPKQVESLVSSALKARGIIASMLENIQCSIPFITGQIDSAGRLTVGVDATALSGLCMLWPLNVIHSCKSISLVDRQWARDMLLDLGRRTGIRRAWALASRKIEVDENTVASRRFVQ